MAEYHVLSNINQSYLFYLFVTYQSVIESLDDSPDNEHDHFIFHVLVDDSVSLDMANFYSQAFKKFNEQSKVGFDFVFHTIDNSCFAKYKSMERDGVVSFATYYRLLMAHVIPPQVQRLLYLDVDIFVRADIRQIFHQYPLDNNEILAASSEVGYIGFADNPFDPDPVILLKSKQQENGFFSFPAKHGIQAGVMLINMEQWRQQDIESRCFQIASLCDLNFWDQDLISIACQGNVKRLSWEWNMLKYNFVLNRLGNISLEKGEATLDNIFLDGMPNKEQLKGMCDNPKIVHFIGKLKPWSLKHRTRIDQMEFVKDTLPYMVQWLDNSGRFNNFVKSDKGQ